MPVRFASLPWHARVAVAAAMVVGAAELVLAARGALAFVIWIRIGGSAVEQDASWFVGMFLAAPVFALLALGWFNVFVARAALRGNEDGYLGAAAGLVLSLGVVRFVSPPAWLGATLALAMVGAAVAGVLSWRRALAQLRA